jgi:hypothetical protein
VTGLPFDHRIERIVAVEGDAVCVEIVEDDPEGWMYSQYLDDDREARLAAANPPMFPRFDPAIQPTWSESEVAGDIFGRFQYRGDFYPLFTQVSSRTIEKQAWVLSRMPVSLIGRHNDGRTSKLPLFWNLCSYRPDALRKVEKGEHTFRYAKEFVRKVHAVALHLGGGMSSVQEIKRAVQSAVCHNEIPPYSWFIEDYISGGMEASWAYLIMVLDEPKTLAEVKEHWPHLIAYYRNRLKVPIADWSGQITAPLPAPSTDVEYYRGTNQRTSLDGLRRWFIATRRVGDPVTFGWNPKLPLTTEQAYRMHRAQLRIDKVTPRRMGGCRGRSSRRKKSQALNWAKKRYEEINQFLARGVLVDDPERLLKEVAYAAKRYHFAVAFDNGEADPPTAAFVDAFRVTADTNELLRAEQRLSTEEIRELVRTVDPNSKVCMSTVGLIRLLGVTDEISIEMGFRHLRSPELKAVHAVIEIENKAEDKERKAAEREAKRAEKERLKREVEEQKMREKEARRVSSPSHRATQERKLKIVELLRQGRPNKSIRDELGVDGKQIRRVRDELEKAGEIITQEKLPPGRKKRLSD